MILINLLPHREEKRQRRKIAFFAGLGAAAAHDRFLGVQTSRVLGDKDGKGGWQIAWRIAPR